jgi:Na+-driven multidrug efflux pump
VAPVAGQNFGAGKGQRVKDTYKDAALMAAAAMIAFGVACHAAPTALIGIFSNDPAVIAVGDEYLRIVSWNYVASGLIFVNSSMFQAMGNTIPSLVTSAARVFVIIIPAVFMARMQGFQLRWIWYLSVGAVLVQLALSLWLLRREFERRLDLEPISA